MQGEWIWGTKKPQPDEYCEFFQSFTFEERALLRISADSLCHGWSALPIYYYHFLSEDLSYDPRKDL